MSFLDTPWLNSETTPQPESSSFARGLRSGFTGLGSQLTAATGAGAEAIGMTDYAADRYARARELAAQAQEEAPPVRSYRDVDGLRSGFDYVTGLVGQSIPQSAAAIGGALLTRRAPMVGSMASMVVPETGDVVMRQIEDPTIAAKPISERLPAAIGGGVASSAAQSVVPTMVAGQIAGKTAKAAAKGGAKGIIAKGLGETALEGASEGGSEAVKQAVVGQHDPQAIKEAVAGGVAAGGAMAGVGGVAEAAHGSAQRAGTSVADVVDATLAKTRETVSKGSETIRGKLSDIFNRQARADTDSADAIARDELVHPMDDDQDPADAVSKSDAAATEWVSKRLRGMLEESGLDQERKVKLTDLLDRVTDPASRAEVAAMDVARRTRDKAGEFYEHMAKAEGLDTVKEKMGETARAISDYVESFKSKSISERVRETHEAIGKLVDNPNTSADIKQRAMDVAANIGDRVKQAWAVGAARFEDLKKSTKVPTDTVEEFVKSFGTAKKSEDYSGVRAVIAKEIIPAIKKNSPSTMDDDAAIQKAADGIRIFMQNARKAKGERKSMGKVELAYLEALLGDDAVTILDNVNKALKTDKVAENENFYEVLNDLKGMTVSEKETAKFVRDNLTNKKNVKPTDVKEAVHYLRSYANGAMFQGMGPEARKFHETEVRDALEKHFGKNVDAVLERFNAELDDSKEAQADETPADDTDEVQFERPAVYGSRESKFILSHDAHKRQYGNPDSQAKRLTDRAEKDHPDRNVSFIGAEEFVRAYGSMFDFTPEHIKEAAERLGVKPEDLGVVAAEGQDQSRSIGSQKALEGRITAAEARSMLRNEKTPAASLIPTEKTGVTLDAYKITSVMKKMLPHYEGGEVRESNTRRTARAFFEGLAAALVHYSTSVKGDLPDTLVIASRNGVKLTFGDIKGFSEMRDPLNARPKKEETAITQLDEYSTEELMDIHKQLIDERAEIVKRDSGGGALVKGKEDLIQRIEREVDTRSKAGEEISDLEARNIEEGRYNSDPKLDDIHTAAKEYSGEALAVKHRNDEASASTKRRADPAAKLADNTEHIGARRATMEDEAKDILEGGSAAEGAISRAVASKDAFTIRKYIRAVNDMKARGDKLRNAIKAVERLNAAMEGEIEKNPDIKYAMQLGAVNEEKIVSDRSRKAVEKYVDDVLGPKTKVMWDDIMHAGEFEEGKVNDIIRLSVHALDPMGAAYHESLHNFFKLLRDQKNHEVMEPLYKAANSNGVMQQLRVLLKDEPAALSQIETDLEERVAYMYQFWSKEKLTLGPQTKGIVSRVKDFILSVLGMWTNDQRAEHIMEYFHTGAFKLQMEDRNAVYRATLSPGRNKVVEKLKDYIEPVKRLEIAVLGTGASRLRDTLNPALTKIADRIAPDKTDAGKDIGFIQAWRNEHSIMMNKLAKVLRGIAPDDLEAAHEALKRGETAKGDAERARVIVRNLLDDLYNYMTNAGVKVGDLGVGKDYFPRVWDAEYISKNQEAFTAMLDKYKTKGDISGSTKQIMERLIALDGDDSVAIDRPGMQHTKERVLKVISPEDAAPFVKKNMFEVLNSYAMQATRRAEWSRRFGSDGFKGLLEEAEKHGATKQEIAMTQKFVHGVLGTLGDQINPTLRRFFGNMIVYQNIRLLPLAIFSQAVDPMGIMVRGGTMDDAWDAFARGIKEIPRGFKKENSKDEWYELAETIGAIEDTTLMHTIGTSYTQGMVSATARKINDALFRFNMVEQFTVSMRVAATQAASRFLMRHADGKYSEHSARFLAELGLKPGDVVVRDGKPLITVSDFMDTGLSVQEAELASGRMKAAMNKWVDGAILRPNAAERPIWMNDPHWALVAHLKTFVYAFQETILKRVWHEIENKNYAPAMALMSYVPIMLAADLLKGVIQGGGEQPSWKKGWTWRQYLGSATERAGLYGVGQFGSDFLRDIKQGGAGINQIMGPTFEQSLDAVKVLGGHAQFDSFAMKGLPANALYAGLAKRDATDPKFMR